MKTELNILIIEDSDSDAFLIMHELDKIGKVTFIERVDNAKNLSSALDEKSWDLIISDYSLPRNDGINALEVIRSKNKDVPVIIISDTIKENLNKADIKRGFTYYIMKNNLSDKFGNNLQLKLQLAQYISDRI